MDRNTGPPMTAPLCAAIECTRFQASRAVDDETSGSRGIRRRRVLRPCRRNTMPDAVFRPDHIDSPRRQTSGSPELRLQEWSDRSGDSAWFVDNVRSETKLDWDCTRDSGNTPE